MPNTYQIIINWDKGQPFAERMSAKIIDIEGYGKIDPQCPTGGPDGTKDIVCYKNDKKYIIGCYFPNGQKDFKDIEEKFNNDLLGVTKNGAQGFVFVTNQKITPTERVSLCQGVGAIEIDIYHGERVCGVLDGPKGYGVRLEYLGIELSKAEQISFLSTHLDLKKHFDDIKSDLAELKKVTTRLAGEVHARDGSNIRSSVLAIAGIRFSSRLSIEDILILHKVVLQSTQGEEFHKLLGFRNVEVWIGNPGGEKEKADFIAASPAEVPSRMYDLLNWWREEFMKVFYSTEEKKIFAIALFHERFLSIHPFLDGNGRVARLLASIQFKDMLDKDVTFEKIERMDYYRALQTARNGNEQRLNDIFLALIKD